MFVAGTRFLVVCMLFLYSMLAFAAPPNIGSFIENQAFSMFVESVSGLHSQLSSNTVRTKVTALEGLQLLTPQTVYYGPGAIASLAHTLYNTGNTTTDYTINVLNQNNDAYDLRNLRIYQDNNSNGFVDTGDLLLGINTPISIAAGFSADLVISGIIPPTVGINVYANILIIANSLGGLIDSNVDAVITKNGAIISLRKAADKTNVMRNDIVNFTLTATNTGNSPALGRTINVDGYAQQKVIIRDRIPANTTFANFVAAAGGKMLYHIHGSALHDYFSAVPADLKTIDAIAVSYVGMPANSARSFSFAISINQNATGQIVNVAQVHYFDAVAPVEITWLSNNVNVMVDLVPPTIKYYKNSLYKNIATTSILGKPLFLEADAATCNPDPIVVETKTIIITSALTGDSENFTLIETGPNTGLFFLSAKYATGIPTRDAHRFSVVVNNGVIESVRDDTLTATLEGCGAVSVDTNILIDPAGCMFNSQTGGSITATSTVTLIDVYGFGNGGIPNGAATVFDWYGNPMSNIQQTDVYGCYEFPLVNPSTYRIKVIPPNGYLFPSSIPFALLPNNPSTNLPRDVDAIKSYGGNFPVTLNTGTVLIDFPLDPVAAVVAASGVVDVYKQVDVANAVVGDVLTYTLTASNTGLGNVKAIALNVDAYAVSMVLVRDIIPANSTFNAITNAAGAQVLYHIIGAASDQYTTAMPASKTQIDAIAFGFANFVPATNVILGFSVTVNTNAAADILNTAAGVFQDIYGNPSVQPSNQVVTRLPATAPTIQYYTDTSYTRLKPSMRMGDSLFVQADAAACNAEPLLVEQRNVTITSQMTGDSETVLFQETGANTGLFQLMADPYSIPTRNGATNVVTSNNGIVEVLASDTLIATIIGCGTAISVQTNILVDPGGIVFDSNTGMPLPNVSVTIIDNATGLAANVLMFDAYTIAPSTILTDSYGFFQFPLVPPGNYHLQIMAVPIGYTYPSTVPIVQLPTKYTILGLPTAKASSGSYGGTFIVTPAAGPIVLDIPMDPHPTIGMFTRKVAASENVELGSYVDYTVDVKNNLTVDLNNVVLLDVLPHGFAYMAGTTRKDGVIVADPQGGKGAKLSFTIATLVAGITTTFNYRVRVGPGSLQGDGTNRAWSESPGRQSNVAQAKVNVIPGMLGDQSYLFGKVYMDCNSDRMQGLEEIGIPGVRLYLQNGTFVITDVEGKWSLYGLKPRTHVVKIDRITLPKNAQLINLSNRHGGDAASLFVDLKKGDWHRADFAVSNCTEDIRKEVYERRDQGEVFVSELQRNVQEVPTLGGIAIPTTATRSPIASGMLNPHKPPIQGIEPSNVASILNAANSNLPDAPVRAIMRVSMAKRMLLMNNDFGFVDLHDGDILPYRQTNVLLKGTAQSRFNLWVNGKPITAKKVGEKNTLPSKQLEVWQYIGLDLKVGKNILRASVKDAFGNTRGEQKITIIAPGDLAKLRLTIPESADADGHSHVIILAELLDADNVPVTVRMPLTLEASLGRWLAKDVNPIEPGVQVFVQGGRREFKLVAPQTVGEAKIKISSGIIANTSQLDFLPALRPMLAVGIVEGRVQLNNFNLRNIMPVRQRDSFEQELRLYSRSNGKRDSAGHAAVFLKGRVLGSFLLTAAYDSDKNTKDRLFRDIQPGEYYPIYGDAAIKGFDAQSTTKLYVRVDHGRSWLLYGDFTTQADAEDVRQLSLYNRTLTGVQQHYENKIISVNGFATRDVSRQVTEEITANGTSGPYYMAQTNMLVNSEKIEILTRDRNQTAVILQTKPLQRFSDYQIEPISSRIIFAKPIASLDANLNPQVIRITYELDQGGQKFWTSGLTANVRVTDHVLLGGTYVKDKNPLNPSSLSGTHARVKLGELVTATAELGRTNSLATGLGQAKRAELTFKKDTTQARIYAGSTDVNFNNPSALLNNGRKEAGAEVTLNVAKTNLHGQLIHTGNKQSGAKRRGLELSANRPITDWLTAELGYRQSTNSNATLTAPVTGGTLGNNTSRSTRLKLSSQIPSMTELGVYGEYEREISSAAKRRAAIGADYQFDNQGKVYIRHEFLTSNSGAFGLNSSQSNASTVVGVDTSYMQDGHLFSEYRARDAISGRESEAAIGLRNGWHVADGVRLSTSLERVRSLGGSAALANSTTVAGGIEYTADPLLKASTRLELHYGTTEDSVLATLGLARKLNFDWSLLGKNTYSRRTTLATNAKLIENKMQLGLAYRQTHSNNINWLGMYELAHKKDDANKAWQQSHLLSTHINIQPTKPLTLTGRYAIKWLNERLNGMKFKYGLQVVSGRAMYDITERWDAGLIASTMYSNGFASKHYGMGAETGYLLHTNLWLSLGYNAFGFSDKEGLADQYTDKGIFLRLRYKFDETLFDGLGK